MVYHIKVGVRLYMLAGMAGRQCCIHVYIHRNGKKICVNVFFSFSEERLKKMTKNTQKNAVYVIVSLIKVGLSPYRPTYI